MYPSLQQVGQLANGLHHSQLDMKRGPLWPLERGFGPDCLLIINGSVNLGAARFDLNLISSKGVAFHFNPRFHEGVVVRNSQTNGSWDAEERSGALTLTPGNSFNIVIFCQDGGYQVLVNGKVFTDFQHRHNPLLVTHLRVEGDATFTGIIYYSNNRDNPTIENSTSNSGETRSIPGGWIHTILLNLKPCPSIGQKFEVKESFLPGKQLIISSTVHQNARRFSVELLSELGVAFQMSVRFDENVVVTNSFTNGWWGIEEREGHVPFVLGKRFSILLVCHDEGIEVNVNDVQFTDYKHRHEPRTITRLRIDGDVSGIQVVKKLSVRPPPQVPLSINSTPQSNPISLNVKTGTKWSLIHGFAPGARLLLKGTVDTYADRFHLDLVSSRGVAFHFNPRFNQKVIVCNSYTNGAWGPEELEGKTLPKLPRGHFFILEILCRNQGIQVSANGSILTNYTHRHDPLTITDLEIGGDAKLHEAHYYHVKAAARTVPTVPPTSTQSLRVESRNNWWLSGGFGPGTKLVLHGIIDGYADRFHLDLVSSRGVAFHFNPRFNQKVIVRNSYTNGEWGFEEREGELKLYPGQVFVVEFLCQNGGIQVSINGSLFTNYIHRHDPLTITNLKIGGDAKLLQALYHPVKGAVTPMNQLIDLLHNLGN